MWKYSIARVLYSHGLKIRQMMGEPSRSGKFVHGRCSVVAVVAVARLAIVVFVVPVLLVTWI